MKLLGLNQNRMSHPEMKKQTKKPQLFSSFLNIFYLFLFPVSGHVTLSLIYQPHVFDRHTKSIQLFTEHLNVIYNLQSVFVQFCLHRFNKHCQLVYSETAALNRSALISVRWWANMHASLWSVHKRTPHTCQRDMNDFKMESFYCGCIPSIHFSACSKDFCWVTRPTPTFAADVSIVEPNVDKNLPSLL